MAKRKHKVTFRFEEDVIFYFSNYDPPVPHCAGETGLILSGEDFFDVTHEEIVRLGPGEHTMMFDETKRKLLGRSDTFKGDDGLFLRFRYEQFAESVRIVKQEGVFCQLLLSFTPNNAGRIMKRLPPNMIDELRRYAQEIPPSLEGLPSERFAVFYSSGIELIPKANLQAMREACLVAEDQD